MGKLDKYMIVEQYSRNHIVDDVFNALCGHEFDTHALSTFKSIRDGEWSGCGVCNDAYMKILGVDTGTIDGIQGIRKRLIQARVKSRRTKYQVSETLQIDHEALAEFELQKADDISIRLLLALAKLYDVDINWLITGKPSGKFILETSELITNSEVHEYERVDPKNILPNEYQSKLCKLEIDRDYFGVGDVDIINLSADDIFNLMQDIPNCNIEIDHWGGGSYADVHLPVMSIRKG